MSYDYLSVPAPLLPRSSQPSPAFGGSAHGSTDIPSIDANARASYDAMFYQVAQGNPNGSIAGALAKSFFEKSGLPKAMLAQIWTLADIDKSGSLDRDEFAVAFHLCQAVRKGIPLPSELPRNLVPQSKLMYYQTTATRVEDWVNVQNNVNVSLSQPQTSASFQPIASTPTQPASTASQGSYFQATSPPPNGIVQPTPIRPQQSTQPIPTQPQPTYNYASQPSASFSTTPSQQQSSALFSSTPSQEQNYFSQPQPIQSHQSLSQNSLTQPAIHSQPLPQTQPLQTQSYQSYPQQQQQIQQQQSQQQLQPPSSHHPFSTSPAGAQASFFGTSPQAPAKQPDYFSPQPTPAQPFGAPSANDPFAARSATHPPSADFFTQQGLPSQPSSSQFYPSQQQQQQQLSQQRPNDFFAPASQSQTKPPAPAATPGFYSQQPTPQQPQPYSQNPQSYSQNPQSYSQQQSAQSYSQQSAPSYSQQSAQSYSQQAAPSYSQNPQSYSQQPPTVNPFTMQSQSNFFAPSLPQQQPDFFSAPAPSHIPPQAQSLPLSLSQQQAHPHTHNRSGSHPFQSSADPFATSSVTSSSFASPAKPADPFGAQAQDPFSPAKPAQDPFATSSHPFAAQQKQAAHPFASAQPDPFSPAKSADPFASASADPFATGASTGTTGLVFVPPELQVKTRDVDASNTYVFGPSVSFEQRMALSSDIANAMKKVREKQSNE